MGVRAVPKGAVRPSAVSERLRDRIVEVVGSVHVRDEAGVLVSYATDATPLQRGRPHLVVFPASTKEVAAVLRLADEARVPVIARGTNLSGGTVAQRGGIILVPTRMNR